MKNTNAITLTLIIALILIVLGFMPLGFGGNTFWGWCANVMGYGGYGYRGMMNYPGNYGYSMVGGFGFGWLFMILIVVALVLFIVWLVQQIQQSPKKQ